MPNQAPYIQSLLDSNQPVPPGLYDVESQIVVREGKAGVGLGRNMRAVDWNPRPNGGVVLNVRWGQGAGSSGNPTKAAVLMEQGSSLKGFAFNYPDQVGPAANAPIEWGSSIQSLGGYDQHVEDILFHKSYIGLDMRGDKGTQLMVPEIVNIRGCPLKAGIVLNGLVDWGTIRHCRFNSGTIAAGHSGGWQNSNLVRWVTDNGSAYWLGGNDWPVIDDCAAWGYHRGVLVVSAEGYGATGPITIHNSQFDACLHGVDVWGGTPFAQRISVENNRFCPFNPFTNQAGNCLVLEAGTSGNSWSFRGNYAFNRVSTMVHAIGSTWQAQQFVNNDSDSVVAGSRIWWGSGPTSGRVDSGNTLRGLT